MKCTECHHLNISSEAECFMCGASLEIGLPPVHPILYVLMAGCIFLVIFSAIGGASSIQPNTDTGFTTRAPRGGLSNPRTAKASLGAMAFRASGLQIHPVAILLGVLGTYGMLRITQMDIPSSRQIGLGLGLLTAVWGLYFAIILYL
jgi:hypothetical protein